MLTTKNQVFEPYKFGLSVCYSPSCLNELDFNLNLSSLIWNAELAYISKNVYVFWYFLTLKLSVTDRPYNNLYDIYDSLSKRHVQGALVDAYVLGSRRDLFDKISVRINRIYDYSSAYGVVLAGEATKLQKCFREHVKAKQKEIFKIIEENVDMIEVW